MANIDNDDDHGGQVLVVDQGTAVGISSAEINQQIATAKRFPRSEGQFLQTAKKMILASDDTASESIYALPRDGKTIEGASIRMAEVLAFAWGNCRYGSRVIDEGEDFITAQGIFFDLERNVSVSSEVSRRIKTSKGRRYSLDMIGVTANAASSIAMRNAILKGIPRAIWGDIYSQARAIVAGSIENLGRRRDAALKAFALAGISEATVLKIVDKRSVSDIEPEDLVTLRGTLTAIRDGDTSAAMVNRTFADAGNGTATEATGKPKADLGARLAAGRSKEAPAAEAGPKEPAAAENEPAAKSEAPAAAEAKPDIPPEHEEILDKLIAALAGVESLEALDPVQQEFGGLMKGKPKAFVDRANELLTKRRDELTPKKESAAKRML